MEQSSIGVSLCRRKQEFKVSQKGQKSHVNEKMKPKFLLFRNIIMTSYCVHILQKCIPARSFDDEEDEERRLMNS